MKREILIRYFFSVEYFEEQSSCYRASTDLEMQNEWGKNLVYSQ